MPRRCPSGRLITAFVEASDKTSSWAVGMVGSCGCNDRSPGKGLSSRMLVCLQYLASIREQPERAAAVPGVSATPVNSPVEAQSAASSTRDAAADTPSAAKKMRTTTRPAQQIPEARPGSQRDGEAALSLHGHVNHCFPPVHAGDRADARVACEPVRGGNPQPAFQDLTAAPRKNELEGSNKAGPLSEGCAPRPIAPTPGPLRDAITSAMPSVLFDSLAQGETPDVTGVAASDVCDGLRAVSGHDPRACVGRHCLPHDLPCTGAHGHACPLPAAVPGPIMHVPTPSVADAPPAAFYGTHEPAVAHARAALPVSPGAPTAPHAGAGVDADAATSTAALADVRPVATNGAMQIAGGDVSTVAFIRAGAPSKPDGLLPSQDRGVAF